ncbi:hypothetical protein [Acidipropionibacterium virtanenii]|nr:hypothetical protein [Acidipropionibacterium virtanenii]
MKKDRSTAPARMATAFLVGLLLACTACGGDHGDSVRGAQERTPVQIPVTSTEEHYAGLDYAISTNGIDFSAPVGLMIYLDGDHYRGERGVISNHPNGDEARGMARMAAKRNMVLVIPRHPTFAYSDELGYTWWENSEATGKAILKLSRHLCTSTCASAQRTWYMGYSGGAEFITYVLAPKYRDGYGKGGAILLAGGGARNDDGSWISFDHPPQDFKKSFDLHWFVGSRDGVGQSENAPEWSALKATAEGRKFYAEHGFTTTRTVLPGDDHESYDFAGIMDRGLKAGGL